MPGVARKNKDKAGGIISEGSSDVMINGSGAVVVGAKILPHGSAPHASSKMVKGSSSVFVNGKAIVRAGDPASCGHKAAGSSDVSAGG